MEQRVSWEECYLEDACQILDSFRKPINIKEREKRIAGKSESELFPYYGATGQAGVIDSFLIDGEFVLLGEDGAPFLDYSKNTAYLIKGKSWVNNHAHILRSYFNNAFLLHFLNQFNFHGYVSGTTRLKLTQGAMRKVPVQLAPLPEQRAIVGKIELLFSELDDGIANLKKAQEQLKIYRQAVLKKAFEGELTKQWREQQTNLPTADDLLKEIKKEREAATKSNGQKAKPIKPLTEPELVELPKLPESWTWVKSAEVIDPINNGYTPKAHFLSPGSGEVPFIKVYNLTFDGTFNFAKNPTFIPQKIHKKELVRSVSYPGDVLINIVGPPLGKVSTVTDQYSEWNINQAIVLFRPNKWISSKYISYSLQNPITIAWLKATSKATAGQFNVKVSTCREIPIPFCPEHEQLQVIQEVETRLSVCDNIEASIKEALFKAKALRQSILKKAFEGKLLNDQELEQVRRSPDWEPAEKLLAQIKGKSYGTKRVFT